ADEKFCVTDPATDLLSIVIEQRDYREVRLAEAVVVRECSTKPAGAHNAYAMRIVEPEYLRDVLAQIIDVVADAAHAKLAEVTKIFPDLRRVKIKLFGQRLRRDGFDSGGVKRVEATKVDTQAAGC